MTEAGKFLVEMYEPMKYIKTYEPSFTPKTYTLVPLEENQMRLQIIDGKTQWYYNINVTLSSDGARLWQDYKTKYILMICVTYSENALFRHYVSYIIYLDQTVQ